MRLCFYIAMIYLNPILISLSKKVTWLSLIVKYRDKLSSYMQWQQIIRKFDYTGVS
jgi:hypothetical protein